MSKFAASVIKWGTWAALTFIYALIAEILVRVIRYLVTTGYRKFKPVTAEVVK